MSARALRTIALALAVAPIACDTAPPLAPVAPPNIAAPPATAAPEPVKAPPTLRRARGEVAVRLAQFDDARTLEIGGADEVARLAQNAGVLRKNGEKVAEVVLAPAADQRWLRVGKRCYAGRLRVRARAKGGFEVTNLVDVEDYVAGVVAGELALWSAEPEALRAQAIAARSYAVAALDERGRKSREPYLFDDVRDQAYGGVLEDLSAAVRAKLARAVQSTRGVVLLEGDSVVDARFHAACSGATADARDVFPETVHACLRSVACEPCATSKDVAWSWTAPRAKLDAVCERWSLGAHLVRLEPTRTDANGRWLAVRASGDARAKEVAFEELRRALGADLLPSSRILRTWPRAGDELTGGVRFDGRGRGHGVGLCQSGARGYAQRGWSAERILAHYYPGARVANFD